MNRKDGMFYAPAGKPAPVVRPGEFVFSVIGLDHGHIYGMSSGLINAGATLKWVYDPDPEKVRAFLKAFPQAAPARSEEEVLSDAETRLIAGACVTSERAVSYTHLHGDDEPRHRQCPEARIQNACLVDGGRPGF